jgi:hypothetical protein
MSMLVWLGNVNGREMLVLVKQGDFKKCWCGREILKNLKNKKMLVWQSDFTKFKKNKKCWCGREI